MYFQDNPYKSLTDVLMDPTTFTCIGEESVAIVLPREKIFSSKRGHVSVLRKSDGLTVLEADGNFIFGLNRTLGIFIDDFIIKISGDYEYALIDIPDARRLIDKSNAWYQVSYILSEMSHVYAIRDTIQSQKSVYHIIKMHLEKIWELGDEQRAKTSIYKYILSRTTISRSALHKVIHELNYGGYIITQRGLLLKVNKLPLRY